MKNISALYCGVVLLPLMLGASPGFIPAQKNLPAPKATERDLKVNEKAVAIGVGKQKNGNGSSYRARKQQEAISFKIDTDRKRKEIVSLVKKGVDTLLAGGLEAAFYKFLNSRNFVIGDVSLFVFDTQGTVYVQGNELSSIWSDFKI